MDTTIRNLDDRAYRSLRAQAAVQRPRSSLRALRPEPFPAGNERLSEEIDSVVYRPRR
jgi:plasmid stability protein